MARIVRVRLIEEPVWLQSSTVEHVPGKVDITREGNELHMRFTPPRSGITHAAFARWDYIVYEDDEPAKAAPKK